MAEGGQLHRDQPLVVVAGDHGVELATFRPHEEAVGRERPGDVEALAPQVLDGGDQDVLLLVPEEAMLARVRVQPAEGDAGDGDAEARQLAVDEP